MGIQQSSTGRVANNGRALPSSLPIIPSDVAADAGAGMASGLDASAGMGASARTPMFGVYDDATSERLYYGSDARLARGAYWRNVNSGQRSGRPTVMTRDGEVIESYSVDWSAMGGGGEL